MHLTVVTAVLLSVGILNAVTAQPNTEGIMLACTKVQIVSCGDGWSRLDDDHCVKFFQTPKSFSGAQEHCNSVDSELVSIHTQEDWKKAICITHRDNPAINEVWIGVERSGNGFTNVDGTSTYSLWYYRQPDNFGGQENCVKMNFGDWGNMNDDSCSDENFFICSKEM